VPAGGVRRVQIIVQVQIFSYSGRAGQGELIGLISVRANTQNEPIGGRAGLGEPIGYINLGEPIAGRAGYSGCVISSTG
jgi:hypothetical protein